jgi:hypothetical protein
MSWNDGASTGWQPEPEAGGFEADNAGGSNGFDAPTDGFGGGGCTNEPIDRPFDGTCNHCGENGHKRAHCSLAPVDKCRICGVEGHKSFSCDAARTDMFKDAPVMSDEEAWNGMKACNPRDMDGFRRVSFVFSWLFVASANQVCSTSVPIAASCLP